MRVVLGLKAASYVTSRTKFANGGMTVRPDRRGGGSVSRPTNFHDLIESQRPGRTGH